MLQPIITARVLGEEVYLPLTSLSVVCTCQDGIGKSNDPWQINLRLTNVTNSI